jgi:hypothetical protein
MAFQYVVDAGNDADDFVLEAFGAVVLEHITHLSVYGDRPGPQTPIEWIVAQKCTEQSGEETNFESISG